MYCTQLSIGIFSARFLSFSFTICVNCKLIYFLVCVRLSSVYCLSFVVRRIWHASMYCYRRHDSLILPLISMNVSSFL